MRSSVALGACLVALVLAPPAFAGAAYDRVFRDYQGDGKIDACKHSEGDLRQAKDEVPNDIEQYAPDFPAALDDALEQRARGACDDDKQADSQSGGAAAPTSTTANPNGGAAPANGTAPDTAPATPTTPAAGAPGTAPAPPGTANPAATASDGKIVNAANRESDKGGDAPAPLIVLAIVGALALLLLAAWALARWLAYEPRWWPGARHSLQEAGWHAGGAWENFTDWLRRGGRPSAS
jgi:cobalamin biosynthesis Mg chelatase CobN